MQCTAEPEGGAFEDATKLTIDRKVVPVPMFHSVGLENHPWIWSHISEPVSTFEAKIALLSKKGFTGVSWQELYEHMAGRQVLPDNSILLTFDDGYLDNWTHVFPILRKYGMKGTIFVSPDFVDPAETVRPNSDDLAAGRCSEDDFSSVGFLSWAEMREMEKTGLIDIQSHAMTHTWYFSGPRIVSFHQPHDVTPNPWLFWNARPDRKPFYLNEDQQEFLPWGSPILEHEKSLAVTRFFPDEGAMDEITTFVTNRGGREYFRTPNWRTMLEEFVSNTFDKGELPGKYESDSERWERVRDELRCSKALIEENLSKQVDYICWPGGANDERVQEIAEEVGYKSWTLASRSQSDKRNRPGTPPVSIKRMSTSNVIDVRGRDCGDAGPRYQLLHVLAHQGSRIHLWAIRLLKLFAFGISRGGAR